MLPRRPQIVELPEIAGDPTPSLADITFGPLAKRVRQFDPETDTKQNRQLDLELARAHTHNSRDFRGLAGYRCLELRIIVLGLRKEQFLQQSEIADATILKRAEEGAGRITTYRALLLDYGKIAARRAAGGDREIADTIERYREEVARLLVAHTGLRHPINRLLYEINLLQGQERYEQCAGHLLRSLVQRDRNGDAGALAKNFEIIRCMLPHFRAGSEALWYHPYVQRLIGYAVADQLARLGSAASERQKFTAVVRTLAALNGPSNREALCSRFQLPLKIGRRLTRGQFVAPVHAERILGRLATEGYMPPAVAHQLRRRWEQLNQVIEERPAALVAARLMLGLKEHLLPPAATARLLGLESVDPGHTVQRLINGLVVANKRISFHALACLAAPTLTDAETLIEDVMQEYRRLPRFRGKAFSFERELMLQYGLRAKDLPPRWRAQPIPMTGEAKLPDELTAAIVKAGERRSLAALNRWIAMVEPATPAELAGALRMKAPSLRPIVAAAETTHDMLRRIERGEIMPSLPLLRRLAAAGGLSFSETLHVNWYLCAAEYWRGLPPFGRALRVMVAARADSFKGFYESVSGSGGNLSIHEAQRFFRGFERGEEPLHRAFGDRRVNKVLTFLEASGFSENLLAYLDARRRDPGSPPPLSDPAGLRGEVNSAEPVPCASLEAAFERRAVIMTKYREALLPADEGVRTPLLIEDAPGLLRDEICGAGP